MSRTPELIREQLSALPPLPAMPKVFTTSIYADFTPDEDLSAAIHERARRTFAVADLIGVQVAETDVAVDIYDASTPNDPTPFARVHYTITRGDADTRSSHHAH